MASFQSASCTCFKDKYNEIIIMYFFKIIGSHWWQGKQRSCWSPPEVVWSKLINFLTLGYMCTGSRLDPAVSYNHAPTSTPDCITSCVNISQLHQPDLFWKSGQIFVVCVPQNSNWYFLNTVHLYSTLVHLWNSLKSYVIVRWNSLENKHVLNTSLQWCSLV